jgi:surface antigen
MNRMSRILAAAALSFGAGGTTAALAQPYHRHYEHRYHDDCHNQNATTGTVVGAIAGGLLGAGASHGNAGAAIGGVILGGIAGNAIGQNIDCDNRPYAIRAYHRGFEGRIGQRYNWRGQGGAYGYMVPVRQYRGDHGRVCRQFRTVTYHHGKKFTREGRACREGNNWRMY